MISIVATLEGRIFQDIYPLLEKDLSITDSQLNQIAKIVKDDITHNLEGGLDYFGHSVQPLAQSTINKKGHNRVFYEIGELFTSILYQKVTTNYYEVFVKSSRDQILSYLQQGNKSNNLPKREPFGISNSAEIQIEKVLSN